jgi:hypothetical protein
VHQAGADAGCGQGLTPAQPIVGFVGVDGGLVARDQAIAGQAVADVGPGQHAIANDVAPLVDRSSGRRITGVTPALAA